MIKIADLITEDCVGCDIDVSSKKRGLEVLSEIMSARDEGLSATAIFNKLISREKLGSTGLGRGVALPHARMEGSERAQAAFVKLREGVDFDAFDHQPVDLLFALVVPEHFTDEHLQILARLAEMFSDTALCQQLRAAGSGTAMKQLISDWENAHDGG
ncbi:MAG: PTS IIA-like nitrogen regulatory protein PtsN [Ectothiorhodospiraceae bacterium]|nr:PTS IIA-like nitrogen regulatory protein PtsN [Ectothiorhodospiraceae bacterium]MCH8504408.1 PTS IIA-like nitrogen regulatory protein PtsN [Ectothiorhodospiraceae bacterium]